VETVVRIALLLDFYGNLLTEKQRDMLRMHYEEDLSLSEIAEQFNVSRAAVHDSVRRGQATLDEYEQKLGLLTRFMEQSRKVEELKSLLLRAEQIVSELKL